MPCLHDVAREHRFGWSLKVGYWEGNPHLDLIEVENVDVTHVCICDGSGAVCRSLVRGVASPEEGNLDAVGDVCSHCEARLRTPPCAHTVEGELVVHGVVEEPLLGVDELLHLIEGLVPRDADVPLPLGISHRLNECIVDQVERQSACGTRGRKAQTGTSSTLEGVVGVRGLVNLHGRPAPPEVGVSCRRAIGRGSFIVTRTDTVNALNVIG